MHAVTDGKRHLDLYEDMAALGSGTTVTCSTRMMPATRTTHRELPAASGWRPAVAML
jgi:hypothetical protein